MDSYKSHIADLQKEVDRLQALVQVLSDDKFFKPDVIPAVYGETVNESPFIPSDFEYQTAADAPPKDVEADVDIEAEFDVLGEEMKSYLAEKRAN